ncbi:MAG TPA: glyoxalase/bleomycin resistance/extradiol dioxygenase family protein [Vicinamibacterales bacterium]|nr:glyoxalase/bleomycin resistance/extradiol dioxygenase family protein [Vicinamibacterales bacterium]
MRMVPILSFKGDCEAALKFYEQCLGAEIGPMFRYGGSPLEQSVPPDWADKIMHANVTIGGQPLQASDVRPIQYEAPKGVSFSLQIKETAEAERVFQELAKEGSIVMALEKTFWAERFGMVVDRFGVPWVINCEG